MTTPACRPSRAIAAAAAILITACSAETRETPADREVPETAGVDNCLLLVWENQADPDQMFDRANDTVEGGAISCATGTSPTQYAQAIQAIRVAARSGDRAAMLDNVGIPLLYLDADGKRRELRDPAEIETVFDEIFDPEMLRMMRDLDLQQMAVENQAGGYFGLGALWLVPEGPGQQPRIVTINRQALNEAAVASSAGLAQSTDSEQ
ncbi:hypothetical protein SAMN06297468_0119 [Altererythrobacter xiamenensis]|uniref:Uncharacterized protein n=1 Tax=Altererythrobacter xiamenensis TaxID=1316679 RepID=A0A1Y6E5V6_9SPHN|nr:hypothetical protein SAMN06297468_0119 [Altererythrobacter xiamenensis]